MGNKRPATEVEHQTVPTKPEATQEAGGEESK